ncbi:MAG: fused response regulator/phosphatase [Proteobacteria bacterium]|nr:fused response regulator/phosphatase [Pseudomonadota bacterium]
MKKTERIPGTIMNQQQRETVLVIEDDLVNRELLKMILKKAGYLVITAENGCSGVEKVQTELPDLVLLDIVMPEMDGITACRILKNDPLTLDIPILMISSLTSVKDKVDCFDVGAADYLPKPFQPQEVLVRVRTHLKLRKLYRTVVENNRLLEEKQKVLDQDLSAAAKVQQHLLPQTLPLTAMEFSWYFQPCQQVSGDIFNVFRLDADHMALYMVDVSGHGVSAALITALVSEFFSTHGGRLKEEQGKSSCRIRRPVEVVALLDKEFPLERFGCYFTIFYLIVDVHSGEYTYCSAGHPSPFLVSSDGDSLALKEGGVPIGMGTLAPPPDEGSGCFQAGQRLLLYTDGVSEYETREGLMYGSQRLQEILRGMVTSPLAEVKAALLQDIREFGEGMEAKDDMSFLLMEFHREE